MRLAILCAAVLAGCAAAPKPAPTYATMRPLELLNPQPHPLPPPMDCLTRRDGATTRTECR